MLDVISFIFPCSPIWIWLFKKFQLNMQFSRHRAKSMTIDVTVDIFFLLRTKANKVAHIATCCFKNKIGIFLKSNLYDRDYRLAV